MKSGGMVDGRIVIDARDWLELFNELEPDMTDEDAIIKLALSGIKPKVAGQLIAIAGELGLFKDYPGSKHLLNSGSSALFNSVISKGKRDIELQNGKVYPGRKYVAPVRDEEEEEDQQTNDAQQGGVQSSSSSPKWLEEKVIDSTDPAAADRAEAYIMRHVLGNIWGRFLLIAEHDPERLAGVADDLKDKIDEMVERLS